MNKFLEELAQTVSILPTLILDSIIKLRFFDYKQLTKRKDAIERFLKMNRGYDNGRR